MTNMRFQWDELLTKQEVADLCRVSYRTFDKWCSKGIGPRVTMLGSVIRYASSDVRAWIESRKKTPEELLDERET